MRAPRIKCKRCGEKRPAIGLCALPDRDGPTVGAEICSGVLARVLQKQKISSSYVLTRNRTRTSLDTTRILLRRRPDAAQIDTSKEGTVQCKGRVGSRRPVFDSDPNFGLRTPHSGLCGGGWPRHWVLNGFHAFLRCVWPHNCYMPRW